MYDFHNSTDTLKFLKEEWAINNFFCFLSDFDETWWSCSYPCVLQFHQISSKSDKNQKSFMTSLFFCSEFQNVSRIVKIVHSGIGYPKPGFGSTIFFNFLAYCAVLDRELIPTMYDFHNSTDNLKFWTEKRAINKTFLFFIWFWWNLVKL